MFAQSGELSFPPGGMGAAVEWGADLAFPRVSVQKTTGQKLQTYSDLAS